MRYRCWHEVVEDILNELTKGPKRITELCLHVKIPVDRGKSIVNHLTRYGLIYQVVINDGTYYVISERGFEWLGVFRYLKSLLPKP